MLEGFVCRLLIFVKLRSSSGYYSLILYGYNMVHTNPYPRHHNPRVFSAALNYIVFMLARTNFRGIKKPSNARIEINKTNHIRIQKVEQSQNDKIRVRRLELFNFK